MVRVKRRNFRYVNFRLDLMRRNDVKMVMKAMLNILQDDGFIVKNAVLNMGLLSAEKSVDIEDKGEAFLAAFFVGPNAVWKKHQLLSALQM